MKYGYMFYKKPLPSLRKERPINIGDPIQTIAIINLYKEMGIAEEDIIPIDRYDVADYDGEKVIVAMNGSETYEHYAYNTRFLPPSDKCVPVYFSLHINRELDKEMIDNLIHHGPVGCRDWQTYEYLKGYGIQNLYVSGCVTMTFPRRIPTEEQTSVFMIECPDSLEDFLPEDIKKEAIRLSQIVQFKSISQGNRITEEETKLYHAMAQERLDLLREKARLVITSRFHAAVPCMAMGIPVILVHNCIDPRFEIVEKYIPMYQPEQFGEIDWNPQPIAIEKEKNRIKEAFFSAIRLAEARETMSQLFEVKGEKRQKAWEAWKLAPKLPFGNGEKVRYAVWGVCLHASQLVIQEIEKLYNNAKLFAMIDSYQTGKYMGREIIQPSNISEIPEDVIILVMAPKAQKPAREMLENTSRRFILAEGEEIECIHFK